MIDNIYMWMKALHIIAFTAWMAGMFYLPRLFAYHTQAVAGGEADVMLQTMERRLLRIIMNPAMLIVFFLGIWLIIKTDAMSQGWMHAKLTLVLIMAGLHGYFGKCRKDFEKGQNRLSAKTYKILNEVPTLLFVIIVLLAVLKPF